MSVFDETLYAGAIIPKNENDAGFEGYVERRNAWLAALKWVIQIAQENPDTVPDRIVGEIDTLGGFNV